MASGATCVATQQGLTLGVAVGLIGLLEQSHLLHDTHWPNSIEIDEPPHAASTENICLNASEPDWNKITCHAFIYQSIASIAACYRSRKLNSGVVGEVSLVESARRFQRLPAAARSCKGGESFISHLLQPSCSCQTRTSVTVATSESGHGIIYGVPQPSGRVVMITSGCSLVVPRYSRSFNNTLHHHSFSSIKMQSISPYSHPLSSSSRQQQSNKDLHALYKNSLQATSSKTLHTIIYSQDLSTYHHHSQNVFLPSILLCS